MSAVSTEGLLLFAVPPIGDAQSRECLPEVTSTQRTPSKEPTR
jgi:hypothetical protein